MDKKVWIIENVLTGEVLATDMGWTTDWDTVACQMFETQAEACARLRELFVPFATRVTYIYL